jgi:molybdate transport system substrate-binding protein
MPALLAAFTQETGQKAPRVTYAASGVLSRQLRAGAPLDGVVLASASLVEQLTASGHLDRTTLLELATNTVVLAVRRSSASLDLSGLRDAPDGLRLALGDPRFVPAGASARRALEAQDLWEAVASRAVLARDVTAAVTLLRRGEVGGAFVYGTDVLAHPELEVAQALADHEGGAPRVVGALAAGSRALGPLFVFLGSEAATEILRAHGFGPPGL